MGRVGCAEGWVSLRPSDVRESCRKDCSSLHPFHCLARKRGFKALCDGVLIVVDHEANSAPAPCSGFNPEMRITPFPVPKSNTGGER